MPLSAAALLLLAVSPALADDFGDALNGALTAPRPRSSPQAPAAVPADGKASGLDQDLLAGIDEGVRTAVEFLKSSQREDGSWGNPSAGMTGTINDNRVDALDDPYSRVAITALVLEGLEKAGANAPEQIARGRTFILEYGLLDPADPKIKKDVEAYDKKLGNNFRPYALGYGLAYVSRGRDIPDRERLVAAYVREIRALKATGRLNYITGESAASSFQLGVVTNGLLDAGAPSEAVKPFLEQLELLRAPDGSFLYHSDESASPVRNADAISGAGRSLPCELAFYRANPTGDRLKALEKALARWHAAYPKIHAVAENASFGHKPPHGYARYYDLFSAYWASEALVKMNALPPRDRGLYLGIANDLTRSLLKDRSRAPGKEKNGAAGTSSWLDEPFAGGRNYGTASALVALTNLRAFMQSGFRPR